MPVFFFFGQHITCQLKVRNTNDENCQIGTSSCTYVYTQLRLKGFQNVEMGHPWACWEFPYEKVSYEVNGFFHD
jgi:hypothetical protein